MDDIGQQINQFLSDPNNMQQLQSMASALGLGGNAQGQQAPAGPPPQNQGQPGAGAPDLSALAGMLGAMGGSQQQSPPAAQANALASLGDNAQMLGLVTKLAPLLGQVNREDDSTRLLRALRPLLSDARQKKVDEAMRILQMMRLLPLLKESGVFSGLLSGLL